MRKLKIELWCRPSLSTGDWRPAIPTSYIHNHSSYGATETILESAMISLVKRLSGGKAENRVVVPSIGDRSPAQEENSKAQSIKTKHQQLRSSQSKTVEKETKCRLLPSKQVSLQEPTIPYKASLQKPRISMSTSFG